VVKIGVTALMMGWALALLEYPAEAADFGYAGTRGSYCAATAAFSGNEMSIELYVDRKGEPQKGSMVYYSPAGTTDALFMHVWYPLDVGHPPQLASPARLDAQVQVNSNQTRGGFTLTVGGQAFRSFGPVIVSSGTPGAHGKVEVHQQFEMTKTLIDALASGGPGRLAYLDNKGMTVAQVDLSFASTAIIQGAAEKTYPTAVAFATNKAQC
jgi:hypothetical protein